MEQERTFLPFPTIGKTGSLVARTNVGPGVNESPVKVLGGILDGRGPTTTFQVTRPEGGGVYPFYNSGRQDSPLFFEVEDLPAGTELTQEQYAQAWWDFFFGMAGYTPENASLVVLRDNQQYSPELVPHAWRLLLQLQAAGQEYMQAMWKAIQPDGDGTLTHMVWDPCFVFYVTEGKRKVIAPPVRQFLGNFLRNSGGIVDIVLPWKD